MLNSYLVDKLDIESCDPPSRSNFLFARDSGITGEGVQDNAPEGRGLALIVLVRR
jgi:hypothetical protein